MLDNSFVTCMVKAWVFRPRFSGGNVLDVALFLLVEDSVGLALDLSNSVSMFWFKMDVSKGFCS